MTGLTNGSYQVLVTHRSGGYSAWRDLALTLTGSAGWMQRVLIETILGFTLDGGTRILLRPRIPREWPGYSLRYRVPGSETVYELRVEQTQPPAPATSVTMDDSALTEEDGAIAIPLLRDNRLHRVAVHLGRR